MGAAFDLDAIRALPADVATMSSVCLAIGEAYDALFRYGRGTDQTAGLAAIQDAFTPATRAIELCKKRTLIAVGDLVSSLPEERLDDRVRGAVRGVQINLVEFTHGVLLLVIAPEFSAANHSVLLAGLREDAARAAPLLAPSARAALRDDLLGAAARVTGADRSALEAIAALYAGEGCTTAVCRVANGV